VEGITVNGGGGLHVGAGEEKICGGILVIQLTVLSTQSLSRPSGTLFTVARHTTRTGP
jgi:hypothetical protein